MLWSISRLSLQLLCANTAVAAAATRYIYDNYVVHEQRDLPHGWTRGSIAPSSLRVTFRIALTQSNLDSAEDMLMRVSDPASPLYGSHWSREDVIEHFAPSTETTDSVSDWLKENQIVSKLTTSRQWLQFTATVDQAEQLLDTNFYVYENEEQGLSYLGCEMYGVPQKLQQHVDFITPTIQFDVHEDTPQTLRQRSLSMLNRNRKRNVNSRPARQGRPVKPNKYNTIPCNETIAPRCLKQLYQFPDLKKPNEKNSMAVVEFGANLWLKSDLNSFYTIFTPKVPNGTIPVVKGVNGGFIPQNNITNATYLEASADVQYSLPVIYPLPLTDFQVGNPLEPNSNISFNNFLDAIDGSYCKFDGGDDPKFDETYPNAYYPYPQQCGVYKPPLVLSISYAVDEFEYTPRYERRQCLEYLKLGLQGTTIFYASGDDGVGSTSQGDQYCLTQNRTALVKGGKRFVPSFPNSCPWVTSVGATRILPNASITAPEAVAYGILEFGNNVTRVYTPSGGFSDVFSIPDYQKAAQKFYYDNYKPPYTSIQYNNSRKARGFPDVSANGVNYLIVAQKELLTFDGTSAATPTFASIITLINNELLNMGKKPVGFVNPALYAHPYVLNDITIGNNTGCGTNGFKAVRGWDPVTGLGTPNYPRMLEMFKALQSKYGGRKASY